MSTGYTIPAAEHRVEMRVVNSRFIATGAYTVTVEEAKAFIARIRAEFHDAAHNVHAYVIGHGSSITLGATDDGEPSGTAGRPMLAVLQGSGLGDISVVVTRYFGGTLLGTGGLVRAYGDAVRLLLESLPITEKVDLRQFQLTLPYNLYDRVRQLVASFEAELQQEIFATDIRTMVVVRADRYAALWQALGEAGAGRIVMCKFDEAASL